MDLQRQSCLIPKSLVDPPSPSPSLSPFFLLPQCLKRTQILSASSFSIHNGHYQYLKILLRMQLTSIFKYQFGLHRLTLLCKYLCSSWLRSQELWTCYFFRIFYFNVNVCIVVIDSMFETTFVLFLALKLKVVTRDVIFSIIVRLFNLKSHG